MKKFNVIVICLVFSCFMFTNMLSAQDFALNLSNVENPVAKSSFLQPVNYTGTTSYYNLFNPNRNVGVSLSLTAPSTSVMLAQANPALNNSKFFDFMSVLTSTSTGSDNAFRFSVGGVLASSVGNVLGLNRGGCDTYSTGNNTPGLNAYFSNGTSSGTPILNTYYNGSTGNSNLGGQGRTITSPSNNFVGLRRAANKQ